jgi:uncharacterized membrane protein
VFVRVNPLFSCLTGARLAHEDRYSTSRTRVVPERVLVFRLLDTLDQVAHAAVVQLVDSSTAIASSSGIRIGPKSSRAGRGSRRLTREAASQGSW